MIGKKTRGIIFTAIIGVVSIGLLVAKNTSAAETGEFSLQVSPSPLVLTLKPGQSTTVDLQIRNTGTATEKLKIAPRSFTINKDEQLEFDDTKPPEVASWLTLSPAAFTVDAGQMITEKVTFAVPKEAGFSYSFALVINRQDTPKSAESGRELKGSVALFTLANIDRPGAVRKLDLAKFSTSQSVYEYLPTELDITLKNTGNTIAQPTGNVFIQRNSNDVTPLSTLSVNKANGYILPDTTRTLKTNWDDGFPVYHTVTASDGKAEQQLDWNWSNLSHLRIGRYTAKLVAIYNDGTRDVPVVGEVSFWVIPWKILLGALVVLLLIGWGLWSIIRTVVGIRPKRKRVRF